jgi:6-phosphogluconolactonase
MAVKAGIDRRNFLKDCLFFSAGAGMSPGRSVSPEAPARVPSGADSRPLLYVGTSAGHDSDSLFLFRLDPSTGDLEPAGAVRAGARPSFLALHPSGRTLYAVNESGVPPDCPGGAVGAFSIDPRSGNPTLLDRQPSRGRGPCHLAVDRTGRLVFAANYGSGSVDVFPVEDGGRLGACSQTLAHEGRGADPRRQEGPHAHCATLSPDNRFVLSCDLGTDQVIVYGLDPVRGALSPKRAVPLPPGSGPRHMAFHPDGRHAYVVNELASTVAVFSYDASEGGLERTQLLSALPDGHAGRSAAAGIGVHPSGRFLYASNRGHDSLAAFSIDGATGRLTPAGHEPARGRTPRHFAIDPSGRFLVAANQESGALAVFRIDPRTGRLSFLRSAGVPVPMCILFRTSAEDP